MRKILYERNFQPIKKWFWEVMVNYFDGSGVGAVLPSPTSAEEYTGCNGGCAGDFTPGFNVEWFFFIQVE